MYIKKLGRHPFLIMTHIVNDNTSFKRNYANFGTPSEYKYTYGT